MSNPYCRAIIGKNFGDEGKGLATNFFCKKYSSNLVVRHNGGAQSGHTVETPDKRFVFHELSSGSLQKADTFWAKTYHPDLYKLSEEVNDFHALYNFIPKIYGDVNSYVTILDDVFINMSLENKRGNSRHGSCGMGIYECDLRSKLGFGITIGDFLSLMHKDLVNKVLDIRDSYTYKHLENLGLNKNNMGEYYELFNDKIVLHNSLEMMLRNCELIAPVENTSKLFGNYEQVLFEGGQGLLLDEALEEYLPNVTGSRTGLYNPLLICKEAGITLNEAVYVTRSYVTRHGNGKLPHECDKENLGLTSIDSTNIPNEWQGSLRYATHGNKDEFMKYVDQDFSSCTDKLQKTLFVTHLDTTQNKILMKDQALSVDMFIDCFDSIYCSDSRFDAYLL
ncbi:MAG: adenylosuccinate synthetase [Saccharofermentans sp.]|nr:adenylosuccinate synthetase [Saccharofermentans sp.]